MNCPSPGPNRIALISCGALSVDLSAIVDENSWQVDLHPLPPLLHNRPERIADEVDRLISELETRYDRIAIGYADCGTYGALDELCERRGVVRLPGNHCYDLYAGAEAIAEVSAREPGTYFLTDFLVVGFDRIVWQSLGLDRYPELLPDYFGNYRQVVWLATKRTPDLERAANRAAQRMGLPLVIRDVAGADSSLAAAMRQLLDASALREWPVVAGIAVPDPATTGHSRRKGWAGGPVNERVDKVLPETDVQVV
jgi:hypothetical protein